MTGVYHFQLGRVTCGKYLPVVVPVENGKLCTSPNFQTKLYDSNQYQIVNDCYDGEMKITAKFA